jgi:hypothetical protein
MRGGVKGEASFLPNQESHVAHLLHVGERGELMVAHVRRVGEMTKFLIEGEKGMRREVWDRIVCHHPDQLVLQGEEG